MIDPHDGHTHILAFAGSLRRASYNRALVRAAAEIAPESMHVRVFELDDIPLYNRDVEQAGLPDGVRAFHEAIEAADGVLIATPEYQHGVPGVLKNAIDWASRPPGEAPVLGKPVAIMGATPGMWGTARAQSQLRQALVYNGCPMVAKPEVLVAKAGERFDEEGRLVHEATRRFVRQLLDALHELIGRYPDRAPSASGPGPGDSASGTGPGDSASRPGTGHSSSDTGGGSSASGTGDGSLG